MDADEVIAEYLETGDESLLTRLDATTAGDARAMRALLAEDSTWHEPDAELLARIEREVAATPQSRPRSRDDGGVIDLAARRQTRADRPARRSAPWITAVAGVAAGLLLAVVVVSVRGGGGSSSTRVALAATASGVTGHADFSSQPSGFKIVLHVDGLRRAPAGSFYQAWLHGPRGLVPIGTFHTGGTVTLWAGVDPHAYPTITVTLEREDNNPASSGDRLLIGQFPH